MPRRSAVLDHPHRVSIDTLILNGGRSVRSIAAEFGLPAQGLQTYARKLRSSTATVPLALAGASPLETFERAFRVPPKAHQATYLTETRPTIVVKGRQTGMTTAAAALAVHTALTQPGSTTVIISPSLRQSGEVSDRARLAFWENDTRLKQDSVSLLRTEEGSRIVSLPGTARGIRGYTCALVIIDEAAFVDDAVFGAARPLVAATGGRLVVQSTPGHAFGWFYELVSDPPEGWCSLRVTSAEAGTVDPAWLAAEQATMDPGLFAQEYGAQFGSAIVGTPLFDQLDAMFTEGVSA